MARSITVTNDDGTFSIGDDNVILSAFDAQPAEPKRYTVDLPGSDGILDLSTALTDGVTRYNNRTVTITFTVINSDRNVVLDRINLLMKIFHGRHVKFNNSGEGKSFKGNAKVSIEDHYKYAIVTITADCDPYRTTTDNVYEVLTAENRSKKEQLTNHGTGITYVHLDVPEGSSVTVEEILQRGRYDDRTVYEYGHGAHILGVKPFYPGNLWFYYTGNGKFSYHYTERDL